MSFLASILSRLDRRALTPANASALIPVGPTQAGPSVTPETAMRSPTFAACARALAETVGSLPVHVYARTADGERERRRDHPADRLLNGLANPWTPAAHLRTAITYDAILRGAGFIRAIRVGGVLREIHQLPHASVSTKLAADGEPSYEFRPASGGVQVLPWRDVVHVITPGADLAKPVAAIDFAREAIGLDIAMAGHQGRIFRKGGRPSGVLQTDRRLTPEALERLSTAWSDRHAGEESGRTAILEEGLKFEALAFTSVDLQFLELRRFVVEEIARAMRVPAVLINDLERATWRNVEELSRLFLTFGLLPWLEAWQGALSRALLTDAERDSLFLEFVVDDLLRADTGARFNAYRTATGGAWPTPNEARALENRPPVDGGDVLILQAGQGANNPGGPNGNA